MGPSCKRKTRSIRRSRRTICKKQNNELQNEETPEICPPCTSPAKTFNSTPLKIDGVEFGVIDTNNSPCSTPKAKRFRIPEITTCPPAPKKRRVITNCSSIQRKPIAFFAPPDLDLFFFVALRNISA